MKKTSDMQRHAKMHFRPLYGSNKFIAPHYPQKKPLMCVRWTVYILNYIFTVRLPYQINPNLNIVSFTWNDIYAVPLAIANPDAG